jgi:hypothetical protein
VTGVNANLVPATDAVLTACRAGLSPAVPLAVVFLLDGSQLKVGLTDAVWRESDATPHDVSVPVWAAALNVIRVRLQDLPSSVGGAVATTAVEPELSAGAPAAIGALVGAVVQAGATTLTSEAARGVGPASRIRTSTAVRGVFRHVPLNTLPVAIITAAQTARLATPLPGNDAAPAVTSADLLAMPGVYSAYRALHSLHPSPGPVLLALATYPADIVTHQTDPIVMDALALVASVKGWLTGVPAAHAGWMGATVMYGGDLLAHHVVRGAIVTHAPPAYVLGWQSVDAVNPAPPLRVRVTPTPPEPLDDVIVRCALWHHGTN